MANPIKAPSACCRLSTVRQALRMAGNIKKLHLTSIRDFQIILPRGHFILPVENREYVECIENTSSGAAFREAASDIWDPRIITEISRYCHPTVLDEREEDRCSIFH